MKPSPAVAVLALAALPLAAVPVGAATVFAGPPGWDHQILGSSADLTRSNETWKSDNGQVLAVLHDGGASADDLVAAVRKNVAAARLAVTQDGMRDCAGRTAHVFAMQFGEGATKTAVTQLIVPDPPGALRVTYTRVADQPERPEARAAIEAFCAGR